MQDMKTQILYEDNEIIVVHKMPGMATQSADVASLDVESELRNYLSGAPLYVVHRLDQPVEGILVFAKTSDAAAKLSEQSVDGRMHKEYTALVTGKMESEEGTLTDYLVKLPSGMARVVEGKPNRMCKKAVLHYHTIEYNSDTDVSKLKIELETGRFHQIRVQFAHAGHPLVGDRKYGSEQSISLAGELGIRFVALCASKLSFEHPATKEMVEFVIDVTEVGLIC